jgi:two-component system, chemotaxis family, CheB/CheR fusion protein
MNNSPIDPSNSEDDLKQENIKLHQQLDDTIHELDISIYELDTSAQEHTAAQNDLQSTINNQEYVNQSLQIANEECSSNNEILQTINEELNTAKKEIQAANRKLTIANSELRIRNSELVILNNDLINFFASIKIAIVILDNDLQIRKFTPTAQQLFNLTSADNQYNFSNIKASLNVPDLEQMISEVQTSLRVKALEVKTQIGICYMLTIRPYHTTEDKMEGFVLVLHDIQSFKRCFAALEEAQNYAEEIIESVPLPLLILDSELRVSKVNREFYEIFPQVKRGETIQLSVFNMDYGRWNIPELRKMLEGMLAKETSIQKVKIEHEFEGAGHKIMLFNAVNINGLGNAKRILLSIEDITDHK